MCQVCLDRENDRHRGKQALSHSQADKQIDGQKSRTCTGPVIEEVHLKWQEVIHSLPEHYLQSVLVYKCIPPYAEEWCESIPRQRRKRLQTSVWTTLKNKSLNQISQTLVTRKNTQTTWTVFMNAEYLHTQVERFIMCDPSGSGLISCACICRANSQRWTTHMLCSWVSGAYVHQARFVYCIDLFVLSIDCVPHSRALLFSV